MRKQKARLNVVKLAASRLQMDKPADFETRFITGKYKRQMEELEAQRINLRDKYAEERGEMYTVTLKYSTSNLDVFELAKVIDNSAFLQDLIDLLPSFNVYRRFTLHLPKGKFFQTENNPKNMRAIIREHQRKRGAWMGLQIVFIDQEAEEKHVIGRNNAMAAEGFGLIFPEFEDSE